MNERVTLFGISPQAVAKLPWGHISLIFSKFDDREELLFYISKASQEARRLRIKLRQPKRITLIHTD
ncbi:hypothetical protein JEZ13_00460 [bacterium]|nr:hypothetical protein [bacterium]